MTPLHTRMVSVHLHWDADDRLQVTGRIFDLRKRGLNPIGGKLHGPGVVHDMAVALSCDFPSLEVRAITPAMSAYPFAPGERTRGESCPDRLPALRALVGRSLRQDFGAVLTDLCGGPQGCFHVFTLLRLIGPTIESAVDREVTRDRTDRARAPGCPLFARSIVMDGMKPTGLGLVLRGMLFDLYYPPGAADRSLDEEMEESYEAVADIELDIPAMTIASSLGRVRHSGPGDEASGDWEVAPLVDELVGRTMYKGYTAQVQEIFRQRGDVLPLQHLLFMLAPMMLQCFPSLSEELDPHLRPAEGIHATVDSCHMWRANGPLMADPPWRPRGASADG